MIPGEEGGIEEFLKEYAALLGVLLVILLLVACAVIAAKKRKKAKVESGQKDKVDVAVAGDI